VINRVLKSQIVLKYGSQVAFCTAREFSECRLSHIIQRHVEPSEAERKILEREFGEEIFGRAAGAGQPPSARGDQDEAAPPPS
jgi:hypothetical protein